MKVLLLSCSTGGGHNSAAKAIGEKLNQYGVETLMIDSIELTNKSFSNKVNKLYIDIVNNEPGLFKKAYHMAELYGKLRIKSPIYGMNYLFAKNLSEFIEKNSFDVCIATHLYPAETLTVIKKKNPNKHFIAVATDYVSIPFWQETNPDYFVIPSEDLKSNFIEKGIDKNKLLSFGIPVSPKFDYKMSKKEAREQLSLGINKKIILMMSGSMGFGNIEDTIGELVNKYTDAEIITICGHNDKMQKQLEKRFSTSNVIVKGFCDNVNVYMDACDVILTKPGGLTSTEVAVNNTPVILTNPIPGCENYNAEFFKKRGMAFVAKSNEDIIKYLDVLLNDKEAVDKMIKAQSKYINKKAATDICEFIIKEYQNKNT